MDEDKRNDIQNIQSESEAAQDAFKRSEKEKQKGKKRFKAAFIRNIALTLLCVVLGVVAALQYRSIVNKEDPKESTEERIISLNLERDRLLVELNSLTAERDDLKQRLTSVEQSSQDDQLKALRDELQSVKTFAGITTVKGRGVYIQVDFDDTTNINNIQQRLLLLINELRASGAQAISINGQRILSMSEVRVVNQQYIAINAEQIVAPYDIYAIGDAGNLYSGITMGGSGIVYQIKNITGATCTWSTQESIVINAADESLIRTDMLKD